MPFNFLQMLAAFQNAGPSFHPVLAVPKVESTSSSSAFLSRLHSHFWATSLSHRPPATSSSLFLSTRGAVPVSSNITASPLPKPFHITPSRSLARFCCLSSLPPAPSRNPCVSSQISLHRGHAGAWSASGLGPGKIGLQEKGHRAHCRATKGTFAGGQEVEVHPQTSLSQGGCQQQNPKRQTRGSSSCLNLL